MDHAQLEVQKEALEKQQEELRTLLKRFATKDPKVRDDFHSRFPDYGSDEAENAEEVSDYQDELGIEHTLEKTLAEVDAALDAITKGTYGTCRVCGKQIESARLAAAPATTLCLEHKDARS